MSFAARLIFGGGGTVLVSYLIVAGGGGSSSYTARGGGGGGAGGLLSGSSLTIDSNSIYVVTVGAGGPAGSGSAIGSNGSNSSIFTCTAIGGGRAGGGPRGGMTPNGASGGSGGGGGLSQAGVSGNQGGHGGTGLALSEWALATSTGVTNANVFNTIATSGNLFGAATTVNIGTNATAASTLTFGSTSYNNTLTINNGGITANGRIIVGNQIYHANIANVLNVSVSSGNSAIRAINLVDSAAVMKIARSGNNPSIELQQWDNTLSTLQGYWEAVAVANNFYIRDRVSGSSRIRFAIDPSGNITFPTVTSTSTSNNTGAMVVPSLGVTGNINSDYVYSGGYYYKDGTPITNTANNASANTIIIQGVDVSQNTRLTVIENTDLSQNVSISTQNSFITVIQGVDVGQNARMTIIEGTDVGQGRLSARANKYYRLFQVKNLM